MCGACKYPPHHTCVIAILDIHIFHRYDRYTNTHTCHPYRRYTYACVIAIIGTNIRTCVIAVKSTDVFVIIGLYIYVTTIINTNEHEMLSL